MIRKLLLTLVFLVSAAAAFSQGYYIVNRTGPIDALYALGGGTVTTLIQKDQNDVLADGTIPFDFTFYGKTYNSYKVSDNGYITFDQSATTSDPNNVALPDASAPKNAIFAFWSDLDTKALVANGNTYPSEVRSYTYGYAPNRVHVIQWFGVSPHSQPSASNYMYFAIRLYENNTFDILYNYMASTTYTFTATVGCQNEDGSMGVSSGDALDFPLKNGQNNPAADKEMLFMPGAQPGEDIHLYTLNVAHNVKAGDKINPYLEFYNLGSSTLKSFSVYYTVDGGSPVINIVNATIASGAKYTMTDSKAYTVSGAPGTKHTLTLWVQDLNGDDISPNPGDDTMSATFGVDNGTDAGRRPLMEGMTGAWCQFCPDGHIQGENVKEAYPDAVIVWHHYVDAMQTNEGLQFCATYANAYPNATIDRYKFSDQATIGLDRSNNVWTNEMASRIGMPTPVKVSIINKTYSGNKITFTVQAQFKDYNYAWGDIRLGAYLVEDYVRGDSTGLNRGTSQWDQELSTVYTNDPNSQWYQYSTDLPWYPHNGVVFKVFDGGVWGQSSSIQTGDMAQPNQTITMDYSYTLPAATSITVPAHAHWGPYGKQKGRYKDNDIYIVGFAAEYAKYDENTLNLLNSEVLNSDEVKLTDASPTAIQEYNPADVNGIGSILLYPNPAVNTTTLFLNLDKSTMVHADLMDITGRTVKTLMDGQQMPAGRNTIAIDVNTLPKGIYMLNLNADGQHYTQKLTIQ
jgi:hypothetical protein